LNEAEAYRLYRMGRFEAPDDDPLGGELHIEPELGRSYSSESVPGASVSWRVLEVPSPRISFSSLFAATAYGISYAAAYLTSPSEQVLLCDFRPQMVGRLIVNHTVLSPDRGLVQIPLREGRNLLLVKVLGGVGHGPLWGALLSFMPARKVGATGLVVSPPRATGFFRGSSEEPEAEISFAVGNTSGKDIFDVAIRLGTDSGSEILRSVEVVRAGETKVLLYGLPTDGIAGEEKVKLEVMAGSVKATTSSILPELHPPDHDSTIYLGTGFHCDPVWTNTQSMYNDISLHNVTQYLDLCRADPEFKVILHELDYLKPYFDFFPENRDYLLNLVRQGRVILGGSYSEPNEKNISGEQLVRNILYGKLFASSEFGASPRVYHAWDVFGHIPQLSQILAKTGNTGVVWSKTVKGFPPIFRHMSLDGSTLLHRRVSYGFTTRSFEEMRERAYVGLKEMESLGHKVDLRMDCTDFKPPTAWRLGRAAELKTLLPRIEIADPALFFERIMDEESSGVMVPVTSRDPSQYHIGTSQSRIELKIANRLGEIGLYNAELLSTLASLYGRAYPDAVLDKAWRQLLFNSHHDGISGTSCDISYLDMMQGYREALHLAEEATSSALTFLAAQVETRGSGGFPLLVFNTLNWERTDVVRAVVNFKRAVSGFEVVDDQGESVAFSVLEKEENEGGVRSARIEFIAKGVPSVGYSTFYVRPIDEAKLPEWKSRPGATSIENEYLKVSIDPSRGGGISSILDKKTGKEFVPPDAEHLANEIAALKEKNDRHEPSWEFHTTGERLFSRDFPAEVSVSTSGPVSKIKVTGRLGEKCQLVREIWLRKGIRRIDLRTEIHGYNGEDDLFVALFPTNVEGGAPTYEERFGAVVKHKGRRFLDYRTWRGDAYSDCAIHSSQNFFDYGDTTKVRFVNSDGGTVGSFPLGSVGLVLPHSDEVRQASVELQKALARRGVLTTPCFDDDDASRREGLRGLDSTEPPEKNLDLGNTDFRISVGLGGNNSYSMSVLASVEEDVLKRLRDHVAKIGFDFLLAYDQKVPSGWNPIPVLVIEARSHDHLKKAIDFIVEGLRSGDLILPQHSNLVGPTDVEPQGLSVLNRGNMANSVEPDGTMVLLLKHTSNWSRQHLEGKFVPERKDHVFLYSIYPHEGSWRSARSYRRGWEFNIPLLSAQTDGHEGSLPPKHSFLQVSADNLVLSALKPSGNPVASFQYPASDARQGIILRVYEAEGKGTKAKFTLSLPIESVWRTDLLENRESPLEVNGKSFESDVGAFSVETFEVKVTSGIEGELIPSGPRAAEKLQPIYPRYWKENLGAAPMGYQPVAISIQGSPITEAGGRGTTLNRISVSIVNNYVDRTITGNAVIEAPAGWRVAPEKIWYEIPPLGHRSYGVTFSFSSTRRTGVLKVRLLHEGQVYEDVVEIGEQSKLTYTGGGAVYQDVLKVQIERSVRWQAFLEEDRVIIRVENPYNESVDGGVALITPLETWSSAEVGDYSLLEIGPSLRPFHIPPKSFRTLEFNFDGENPPFWIYAKLFYMGRTDYKRIK